jgi:hypothetical protein
MSQSPSFTNNRKNKERRERTKAKIWMMMAFSETLHMTLMTEQKSAEIHAIKKEMVHTLKAAAI